MSSCLPLTLHVTQSRCLALVPLSMGSSTVEELDDLFDEEWTDSMEMVDFWPSEMDIDQWKDDKDDEIFEKDDYIDKWVNIGKRKRSLAGAPIDERDQPAEEDPAAAAAAAVAVMQPGTVAHHKVPAKFIRKAPVALPTTTTTALSVRDEHLMKRCPICFLIPIFAAVARTVGAVVARVGAQVAKGAVKIAKGRGKNTKRSQREGAEKVSKDKNWRNCLHGMDPVG